MTAVPVRRCPTCDRHGVGATAVKVHHARVHGVSLRGVDPEDWDAYLADRAVENPDGETARDRRLSPPRAADDD